MKPMYAFLLMLANMALAETFTKKCHDDLSESCSSKPVPIWKGYSISNELKIVEAKGMFHKSFEGNFLLFRKNAAVDSLLIDYYPVPGDYPRGRNIFSSIDSISTASDTVFVFMNYGALRVGVSLQLNKPFIFDITCNIDSLTASMIQLVQGADSVSGEIVNCKRVGRWYHFHRGIIVGVHSFSEKGKLSGPFLTRRIRGLEITTLTGQYRDGKRVGPWVGFISDFARTGVAFSSFAYDTITGVPIDYPKEWQLRMLNQNIVRGVYDPKLHD